MNKKHMKKRLLIFAAAILMIITTVTVHYKTEVRSEAAGIKTQQETKKKIIGAPLHPVRPVISMLLEIFLLQKQRKIRIISWKSSMQNGM